MRVLILAAGLGTRLRPMTNSMPKALVPVAGRPNLDFSLRLFERYGFSNVRINMHYLGDQISEFVAQNASKYNLEISLQDERDKLLGSGGAIALAREWLFADSDSALIWNPDGLLLPNLSDFLTAHKRFSHGTEPAGSIITFPHPEVGKRYNAVCVASGLVLGFTDVSEPHEKNHFAGGYILNKAAADLLPEPGSESDVVREVWRPLVRSGRFQAWRYEGPYQDLGCPDDIAQANARLAAGEFS